MGMPILNLECEAERLFRLARNSTTPAIRKTLLERAIAFHRLAHPVQPREDASPAEPDQRADRVA